MTAEKPNLEIGGTNATDDRWVGTEEARIHIQAMGLESGEVRRWRVIKSFMEESNDSREFSGVERLGKLLLRGVRRVIGGNKNGKNT